MHCIRSLAAWRITYSRLQSRTISGYKISAENYERGKHAENLTEEDLYQEKVKLSVLKKAKSPLYVFDKITGDDVRQRDFPPNPNELYFDNPEAPKYRSVHRYMQFAERERRRQRKEGVPWKTLDYWIKEQKGNGDLVNIGFKLPKTEKKSRKELRAARKADPDLEKRSRERTLVLDLDKVNQDWERSPTGIAHIQQIAHHYNVYKDLFGAAEFHPVVHMDIDYDCSEEYVNTVYYGNELLPSEVASPPTLQHEGPQDKLYTLLLTNPDEHLEHNDREYVHWLVGNIPGNDVAKGDTLVNYLPPFPARGTGYHRMVYVLFLQNDRIDFTTVKREAPCTLLRDRDFKTSEFYKQFEGSLTPASLRFFQCKWEACVRDTFHNVLKMPEPVYEYAKPTEKPRLKALRRTPHRKTLIWLSRFFPNEPTYPDGSPEEKEVRMAAARDASSYKNPNRGSYPMRTVYEHN